MTSLQLLILSGMLLMAGVGTFLWWASPAEPDLSDAFDRLSPRRKPAAAALIVPVRRRTSRALGNAPASGWLGTCRCRIWPFCASRCRRSSATSRLRRTGALMVPLLAWLISWPRSRSRFP